MKRWTFDHIPDQTGRTAVVTGANTGIGLETARMLALKGAHVVLACRDVERGRAAVERVLAARPIGSVTLAALDLSDLDSVTAFATTFAASHARLALLINNAGVMVPPLGRTRQGFELQLGTNHLGHFALAARLLPLAPAYGRRARRRRLEHRPEPRPHRRRRSELGAPLIPSLGGVLPEQGRESALRARAAPAALRGGLPRARHARSPGLHRHRPAAHVARAAPVHPDLCDEAGRRGAPDAPGGDRSRGGERELLGPARPLRDEGVARRGAHLRAGPGPGTRGVALGREREAHGRGVRARASGREERGVTEASP